VEIAHGRNEGDAIALQAPGAHGHAQCFDALDAVHQS
jgi:hypothetical protein